MVRTVVTDSLAKGQNPKTAALELVGRVDRRTGKRVGGFIGLTDQQAGWVLSTQDDLRNLDANYFTRELRDKRYDRMVRKAIKEGKPLSEADVLKIGARYKARALKYRADTIARDQSLTALSTGRFEGFKQLVESGKVTESQIKRSWSDTGDGRERPYHRMMDNQTVTGLSEPYTAPDGSKLLFPRDRSLGASGKHTIGCRCWETVKIKWKG